MEQKQSDKKASLTRRDFLTLAGAGVMGASLPRQDGGCVETKTTGASVRWRRVGQTGLFD